MGLLKRLVGKTTKTDEKETVKKEIQENLVGAKSTIDGAEHLMDSIIGVVESASLIYNNGDMTNEEMLELIQKEDNDMKETVSDLESFLGSLKDYLDTISSVSDILDVKEEFSECQRLIRHGYRLIRSMHIEYNMVSCKFTGDEYYVVELEVDSMGTVADENSFKRMIHLSGDEQEVFDNE